MIPRFNKNQVLKYLYSGKVIRLIGPRRAGKTILMEEVKKEVLDGKPNAKILMVNGENLEVQEILSSQKVSVLGKFIAGFDHLFIDEAQRIPNIGINLKLLIDAFPRFSIFVTGSSAFDLLNKTGEPLVGRNYTFYLYPVAQLELMEQEDYLSTQANLESRLIYGSYPEVVTHENENEKINCLKDIRDGYLIKDLLELDNLKNSLFIMNLLRLIAFQIGNDISYTELAGSLLSNPRTVMRYLDLLEKTCVLFSQYGLSRNLRKEYKKTPRYFFWDNGIRNTVISNFNPLSSRDDIGKLWENYIVSERLKKTEYRRINLNRFFWRTYDQQEVDYVEEREGKLFGYEIKWGKTKYKKPKDFLASYKNSSVEIINKDNYIDFIT